MDTILLHLCIAIFLQPHFTSFTISAVLCWYSKAENAFKINSFATDYFDYDCQFQHCNTELDRAQTNVRVC